jgi:hypothetical protein
MACNYPVSSFSDSLEEEFGGEKLSEDHIRSAASSYARGELPVFQNALSAAAPKDRSRWTVDKTYSNLLEEFSNKANKLVLNLLPFDQLKTILILVVFATMRWDLIANLIPIFVFYVSLVIAVGANCQMLQVSKIRIHIVVPLFTYSIGQKWLYLL